jgi:hypothetical protein
MRYAELITIRSFHSMPIAEFLETNEMVKQQAAENGQAPVDWVAGQFLPDADLDENFGNWIVRQSCSILQTVLLRDTMSGSSHVAKKVSNIVLAPEDCNWLVRTLGRHSAVLKVWRSMALEVIAA